jgi:hypothetical protein
MGERLGAPAEALAHSLAERMVEIVVAALDINALLDRVDLNALLGRVNVNSVVQQVDVDELIKKVDLEALLGRVDVNALIQRVDVDALVTQTDLAAVMARSSAGFAGNALDVARSQAVGLDELIARWTAKLRHRGYAGPPRPCTGRGAGPS